MSSVLRSTTYQLHVKNEDGVTKMKSFSLAVKDSKATIEELNRKLGDNVTVTQSSARNINDLTRDAARLAREHQKTTNIYEKQSEALRHQISLVGKSAEEQAVLNAQFMLGANATEAQKQEIAELTRQHYALNNAQDKTQSSMRNLRGVSQNLGWQLQDVAVQAQMGTSWFTIIAQQGSQMAAAFGAIGALVGAGIAVGFAMLPSVLKLMGDTTLSAEELKKAHEKLNGVLNTTNYTVKGVSKELYELYKVDKQLARLKLVGALHDAENAMQGFRTEMKDSLGDTMMRVVRLQEQISKGITEESGSELFAAANHSMDIMNMMLDKSANKLGITRDQMFELAKAYEGFTKTGDTSGMSSVFGRLSKDAEKLNPEFKKLIATYAELASKGELTKRQVEELNKILEEQVAITDPDLIGKNIETMAQKYLRLRQELTMTDRQIELSNAKRELGNEKWAKEGALVTQRINQYYDEMLAIEAVEAAKERSQKQEEERKKFRDNLLDKNKAGNKVDEDPVVAEMTRHNKVLEELTQARLATKQWEYTENARINEMFAKEMEDHTTQLAQAQFDRLNNQVALTSQLASFMNQGVDEMYDGGERVKEQISEMDGLQKTMFFTMRAISAAQALINGIEMGAIMAKNAAFLDWTGMSSVSAQLFGTTMGAANAGAIMGATFAGFFDKGGYIPSGQKGVVAEYQDELVNGVMVQGPARVTSSADTAKMMNGGGLNVTVENHAPGVSHSVQQMDDNSVRIIATQVFNENIDRGVSTVVSKRGSKTNKALVGNYDLRGKV